MKAGEVKLSSEFKAQTTQAILSIILFTVIYLIILVLALGLTALCVYAGLMLIISFPRYLTIALGIGLASFGVLILIFLVKFIFKSQKIDTSGLIEIKASEEPELFELISDIVTKVGTRFPKRVYLSNDVNASAFYDSNFWSMFLPIRKNLRIGVGLANSVTKVELTAILAHEFGHFSQKTMKVGSYVYNVNQVIFNMLFEDESYDKLIQNWANASGFFAFFVVLAVKIIEGIRWILVRLYGIVNKSYMGLSREMEFHADEIAATVTGFEPLKTSLARLNLADHSFTAVLQFYDNKVADSIVSRNLYKEHRYVMNQIAKDSDLPVEHGFPQVTQEVLSKFNKSKLIVEDQWASHPSLKDRVDRLEKTNLIYDNVDHSPANNVFINIEQIQRTFTDKVFKEVKYEDDPRSLTFEDFVEEYNKEQLNNSFSELYNGYYDTKNPLPFDVHETANVGSESTLEELYGDDKIELVYTALALENDIGTVKQIANKEIGVKSFDYAGVKYKRSDCKELLAKLETQLTRLTEQIKENDVKVFQYFAQIEKTKGGPMQLEGLYTEYIEFDKEFDSKYDIYIKLQEALQFINYTTPIEQIRANLLGVKSKELILKSAIKDMMEDPRFQSEITPDIKKSFEQYLSKDWKYFGHESYYDEALGVLFDALNNYAMLYSKGYYLLKKRILEYQQGLVSDFTTDFL